MNATIYRTFQQLYGLPCWGVHYARALNLSMNFGEPSLRVREPYITNSKNPIVQGLAARRRIAIRGKWWLWIYCCHWRLSLGDEQAVTSASSDRKISRAIAILQGQKVVSVAVEARTGATRFSFDLGGVLDCRRFNQTSDADLWTLYKPNGYVLATQGTGTFSHQRGSEREKRLKSI